MGNRTPARPHRTANRIRALMNMELGQRAAETTTRLSRTHARILPTGSPAPMGLEYIDYVLERLYAALDSVQTVLRHIKRR